jgi:CRP/FNR family transcriptional regulator
MKNLNGVGTQNGFGDGSIRGLGFVRNLSIAALRDLDGIKIHREYTKGSRLFVEGQLSEGIHLLCTGRVKLTTHSRNGKALIMNVAVPGDVLGLSAAVSNVPHDATAETIETCRVDFVPKADFFHLLNQHPDAGMNAIEQLSRQCNIANAQVRSFGLSSCVADKLTKLLIDWSDNSLSNNGSVHLKVYFSHEEMAEMIGASRETVTRLLKTFRERGLISIKGSDLFIHDKHKLEATIGNGKDL